MGLGVVSMGHVRTFSMPRWPEVALFFCVLAICTLKTFL